MSLYKEALDKFAAVYEQAQSLPMTYPNAMTLATVDKDANPSARVLLLKDWDEHGFVFYTNKLSHKGHDLELNPRGEMLFYWESLHSQIRINGIIESVTDAEADEYWATRPLESKLGAWASHQSEPLADRDELEQRFEEYSQKFAGKDVVPRPEHWSGYRLIPGHIEFWKEKPFRFHERVCYDKSNGDWTVSLLNP